MSRYANFALIGVLLAGAGSAFGYSPWGPKEGYQTDDLGWDRLTEIQYPFGAWLIRTPEFLHAAHSRDEEFRWSVPVIYYTYDPSFVDYFGTRGIAEVDAAAAILNRLTNVSSYSQGLTEFPLNEFRENSTAAALKLFDLKSAALEMLVTRLGLTDPEESLWGIRTRTLRPGSSCPQYDYTVVERNYDPITGAPTPYVNGALFTYSIEQHCPPDIGDYTKVRPQRVSNLDVAASAVASQKTTLPSARYYGLYHVSLTRDDVGGLRDLYRNENLNFEAAPPDSLFFETNTLSQLLFTSNLTLLAEQALTNPAPALQLIYPNLVILSTTNTFTNVPTIFFTPYLTNFPWDPIGTFRVGFATNIVLTPTPFYHHIFGNVIGFRPNHNGGWETFPIDDVTSVTNHTIVTETTETVSLTNLPFAPAGNLVVRTNTTVRNFVVNRAAGDFVILPTNFCDVKVIAPQFTNVVVNTNAFFSLTNTTAGSNVATVLRFTLSEIDYFTNHAFIIWTVGCVTNAVALRQGLEKISFVRRDFDSLLNRFFQPVTNDYTMLAVTNNTGRTQHFRRIVTRPDILFAAADVPVITTLVETVDHFNSAPVFDTNTIPGLAGPGTIQGPIRLTFNKVGPIHLNSATGFLDEQGSIFWYNWASYDGSTNAPYIYPQNAEHDIFQQLLLGVSPDSLPVGTVGAAYSALLTGSGGQPPYSWSRGPGSPNFPPGLDLSVDPANSALATLSGTPVFPGTYNFWVRMTDAASRFIDQFYVLTVNPP